MPFNRQNGLKFDLKTTLNELKVVFVATYSGLKVPFKSSLNLFPPVVRRNEQSVTTITNGILLSNLWTYKLSMTWVSIDYGCC